MKRKKPKVLYRFSDPADKDISPATLQGLDFAFDLLFEITSKTGGAEPKAHAPEGNASSPVA